MSRSSDHSSRSSTRCMASAIAGIASRDRASDAYSLGVACAIRATGNITAMLESITSGVRSIRTLGTKPAPVSGDVPNGLPPVFRGSMYLA